MTEPLVPSELVWGWKTTPQNPSLKEVAETPFGSYGYYANGSCDYINADVRDDNLLNPAHMADKAAAQQHYNELVAACCTVKRCVWNRRGVDPSLQPAFERSCNQMVSRAYPEKHCPSCGGIIQVEGGE